MTLLPSARLLWIAAVLFAAAIGVSIYGYQKFWVGVAALLAIAALFDAWAGLRLPSLPWRAGCPMRWHLVSGPKLP